MYGRTQDKDETWEIYVGNFGQIFVRPDLSELPTNASIGTSVSDSNAFSMRKNSRNILLSFDYRQIFGRIINFQLPINSFRAKPRERISHGNQTEMLIIGRFQAETSHGNTWYFFVAFATHYIHRSYLCENLQWKSFGNYDNSYSLGSLSHYKRFLTTHKFSSSKTPRDNFSRKSYGNIPFDDRFPWILTIGNMQFSSSVHSKNFVLSYHLLVHQNSYICRIWLIHSWTIMVKKWIIKVKHIDGEANIELVSKECLFTTRMLGGRTLMQ